MSPAELLYGQQALRSVRAAGSGGQAHKQACEDFAGWAMEHAEELLGLVANAVGIPGMDFAAQNMRTRAETPVEAVLRDVLA